MAYPSGVVLPKEDALKDKMKDHGKIKDILFRPAHNNNLKSFVLLDFESLDQAKKVRKYFFMDDKEGRRRSRLGDRKIEISILVKSKDSKKFEVNYTSISPVMANMGMGMGNSQFLGKVSGINNSLLSLIGPGA